VTFGTSVSGNCYKTSCESKSSRGRNRKITYDDRDADILVVHGVSIVLSYCSLARLNFWGRCCGRHHGLKKSYKVSR
jgi:hypothetical protein